MRGGGSFAVSAGFGGASGMRFMTAAGIPRFAASDAAIKAEAMRLTATAMLRRVRAPPCRAAYFSISAEPVPIFEPSTKTSMRYCPLLSVSFTGMYSVTGCSSPVYSMTFVAEYWSVRFS